MSNNISFLFLQKEEIKKDWKFSQQSEQGRESGRKVLVNHLYDQFELSAQQTFWHSSRAGEKVEVVETGLGGIEISTFSHRAKQESHMHKIATEIYTVLEGKMAIKVENEELVLLSGDEVILFPGTVHEILNTYKPFLTRVHAINSYGKYDKYILHDGKWQQLWSLQNQAES